jgi:hypothetical protein
MVVLGPAPRTATNENRLMRLARDISWGIREAGTSLAQQPVTPIPLRERRRDRIGKNPLSHHPGMGGKSNWLLRYLYLENQVA